MSAGSGSSNGTSRARARACEDIEDLSVHEPATPEARRGALKNAHALTLRALGRVRRWSKDGEDHEAADPDIGSAVKCQDLSCRLLRLMPEGGASKAAEALASKGRDLTSADYEEIAQLLRANGYPVGERRTDA